MPGAIVVEGVFVVRQARSHLGCCVLGERPIRVVLAPHHERGDGRGENDAAHPVGTVLGEVPGHFTAAHGKSDEGRVGELECLEERVQVCGEGVVDGSSAATTTK